MRSFARAASLGILLTVVACKGQPLPPDKAEFAGHWRGGPIDLVIHAEGRVEYVKTEGKGRVEISGPLQGWSGDDFVVGVMTVKTTFDVQEPPHQVGDIWVMKVDGVELTRVE